MNKENYALKLVDEIILYYDARSKKHQNTSFKLYYNFLYKMELFCMEKNYYKPEF